MLSITVPTMVSVPTETLLSALDVAISDNSIRPHDITDSLSPNSKRILMETLLKEGDVDIKEFLTGTQIEEIQDEREIDVDAVLDSLDYDCLLSHIIEHRSPKEIIYDLVNQL